MFGEEPAPQMAPVESPQMVSSVKLPILKKGEDTLWSMRMEQYITNNKDAKCKSNFLRALPSSWNNIALIMRNKEGIDELDIDDPYNNLKVFEADIKGSSGSSLNSQNVAFLSAEDTNSINEVNTANGVSTTAGHSSSGQASSSSYTDDLMFSFFASQSNSPQLDNEDLEQIDHDDLEEKDLKWQVAMLFMRVKRFYKKTRRKLNFNSKEHIAFDKTKVKCFNYHRRGHFVRECSAPINQGNKIEMQDKTGLGYGNQLSESDSEVLPSVFDSRSSDGDDNLTNDRFKKGDGYHKVPPPLTRNYMPPLADLSFVGLDDSIYRPTTNKASASISKGKPSVIKTSNISVEMPKFDLVWTSRVIIDDWENPQQALKYKGMFDSGCSKHMIGYKALLTDYQDIDGGFVTFGESTIGGKITDKFDGKAEEGSSDDKAGDNTADDAAGKEKVQEPVSKYDQALKNVLERMMNQEKDATEQSDNVRKEFQAQCNIQLLQEKVTRSNNTNSITTVSTPVNTASASRIFIPLHDPLIPELEDTAEIQTTGIFGNAYDEDDLENNNHSYADESVGAEADFSNMEPSTVVGDEAVHKELGDRMERAATTTSSLEVEQDSEFCDKHNVVAYLDKLEGSEGFHQIIDFLSTSHIKYALTENPTIYASLIEQFWQTAALSIIKDGVMAITATIDRSVKVWITEASIRRHLKLGDSKGLSTLHTKEFF
nr:hypothetical protein [Tanacetum cinerariifolium]